MPIIFAISGLINGLAGLIFALFVIFYNPRDKINRLYFLLGLANTLWGFGYWQWQLAIDASSALFWVRILSIGSLFIPVFYFHWIVSLLEISKKNKYIVWLNYIFAIIILFFSFSDLFIKGVSKKMFFDFWPNPGILYNFYLVVIYILIVFYSLFLLFWHYKVSSGEKKYQIVYVIIGSIIGFGGGLTNFLLWYNIQVPPYGTFFVVLYPLFLGYAVIKYRLFDIKIITTALFIFLIWVALLMRTLLSENFQSLFINGGTLLIMVILGILLARAIFRDVRQREEIAKMAEDVRKAYVIEKRAKEEIERLDKFKDQFLMTAQHNLRTPLTSMMGYADLLLKGMFGKQNKKTIEVIQKFQTLTQNMIRMVNNFLDMAQFQLGKSVITLKPDIDVLGLINEIVQEIQFKAESKGIYVKVEKPEPARNASGIADAGGKIFTISADREKLKAAIFNIVDNAVKYTEKGGVTINIKNQVSNIKIVVQDTGIGIPKEKLSTIFDQMFERSEEAKRVASLGSGVGLYLSGEIIKAHKGKVWVESPARIGPARSASPSDAGGYAEGVAGGEGEGKGSTFYIELPITNEKTTENTTK
ncbi:MAG: ATP-binding protein [Patescibacteria group bacterium]